MGNRIDETRKIILPALRGALDRLFKASSGIEIASECQVLRQE